ncbi:hypothetical protein [uncultured Fibrella sp.]|uniref:hypothetical protein n=1 Tax=uncultured Fibrella sp. TaxID=1284596 RepID=UPI0035CAE26A
MIALALSALLLTTPIDSILPADTLRSGRAKTTFAFNLDFRDSFLERQHVNVWGVNAGIEFGHKRHQLTLGYYWLSYATYLRLIDWHRDAAKLVNLNYYTRTDLWFVNAQYWMNITNNRHWMVSFPMEVGGGVAYAIPHALRQDIQIDRTQRSFFVPLQVGAYTNWKATRWAGLSVQIGYRYSIFQTDIDQNFNGMYYSIGVTVYPALATDVWRFLTKKDRISPVHPPQPHLSATHD